MTIDTTRRRSPSWLQVAAIVFTTAGVLGAVGLALVRNAAPSRPPTAVVSFPPLRPPDLSPKAAPIGDGIPSAGRRTLVVFLPDAQYGDLAARLADGVQDRLNQATPPIDIIAVLPTRTGSGLSLTPIAYDVHGAYATAYGLPSVPGKQPSVGYALVDAQGRIRAANLDARVVDDLPGITALATGPM